MADEEVRIAIVDDSPSVLSYLAGLVTSLIGVNAAVAFNDSRAALEWCAGSDVDLILVDYVMPGMDGLQFIENFRKDRRRDDVPVVMVTTSEARTVRHKALQLGATDFLRKPVDEVEFSARIRNLLTVRRHHRETRNYAKRLAQDVLTATQDIVDRERETILALSRAAEFRDNETGAHLTRMSNYCRILGERLALPPDEVDTLFAASPMHDIGKIGIPDHVLLKPGKLTDEEREVMKRHPLIGWRILGASKSRLLRMAADIAISHHEKWDGSGYPHGLTGENIPLVGRITAVADVFDALTSARPYKAAWPIEKALDYLRDNRELHFDPACVDAFFLSLDEILVVAESCGLDDCSPRPLCMEAEA